MPRNTPQQAGLYENHATRIQNAANKTGQRIILVGSRARWGSIYDQSHDWDYILYGNSHQRHSAMSSLPGWTSPGVAAEWGLGRGVTTTGRGIDIFQGFSPTSPDYEVLDTELFYVQFDPQ